MLPAIIAKIKASLEGVALEKTDEERRLAVDLTRQELEASPHEAEINCDTKLLLGHGTELHLHGAAFAQRHSQVIELCLLSFTATNQFCLLYHFHSLTLFCQLFSPCSGTGQIHFGVSVNFTL